MFKLTAALLAIAVTGAPVQAQNLAARDAVTTDSLDQICDSNEESGMCATYMMAVFEVGTLKGEFCARGTTENIALGREALRVEAGMSRATHSSSIPAAVTLTRAYSTFFPCPRV